jgi:TPR repeat protein
LFYEGRHVPADAERAVRWITRAAEHGNAFAQAWLGDVRATQRNARRGPAAADA